VRIASFVIGAGLSDKPFPLSLVLADEVTAFNSAPLAIVFPKQYRPCPFNFQDPTETGRCCGFIPPNMINAVTNLESSHFAASASTV
jgi:hypothetical protein